MGILLGSGTTKPQYPYDHWYGVEGDFTSNDYLLKRVGNLDLHRTLPIQNKLRRFIENEDGSVKYYLHQNDSRRKESGATAIIDSTDGNVMLEIPEFYFRMEVQGTKWIRAYSEYPLPGFIKINRKTIAPFFSTTDNANSIAVSGCWLKWDDNDELLRDENGILILADNAPLFRGGNGAGDESMDGTVTSQLGMPRTYVRKDVVRPMCINGTHHGAYRAYNEIAWLQRVEYASLHCQDVYDETLTADGFRQGGLGNGPAIGVSEWNTWGGYRPFIPSGVTAVLGNNTGKVQYIIKGMGTEDKIVEVTSYRGFENPYQYLWMLADDILAYHHKAETGLESTMYLCEDSDKFTSHSDLSVDAPDGYVAIANIPRSRGYIKHLTTSDKNYTFPMSIGGWSNSGACDYFYAPGDTSEGWYGSLPCGTAASGAAAGFGFLNTRNRSSDSSAYIGFRLCRF